jgi:tRNA A-37 threonylcarbamoyl transferase component Bud32
MIGQVLSGNYRLTDLVGSGGYADVYLARDLRTNTLVAVKILHQHIARDPDLAARFEREAALARRLQTPHVARVLDSGQDATSPPYMVMEYVQGLTLAELLRRHGPFPILEAVEIVDQVLSALGTAHALGIVHRDIKPQNLMLDAGRRLKVLDFGIARVAGAGTMTASGHLLGTPEYMALEQVEGQPVDQRADLYAAGAVLYQLLTGRPPYVRLADTDIWELIRKVRTEPPPSIRVLRPDVPSSLAGLIERAMARNPAGRFQSAQEMREALAVAAGTDPPTPRPAAPVPPTASLPPDARPTREMPAVPAAGPYPPAPGSPVPSPPLPPGATRIMPAAPGAYPPRPGAVLPGPHGAPSPPRGQGGTTPLPPYQQPGLGAGNGQRAGRGMSNAMIAMLAVGALVLVVIGALLGRLVPLPGGSGTATPTAVAATTTTRQPATVAASGAAVASPSPAGEARAASPSPVAVSSPVPSPSPRVAASPGAVASPSPAPRPTTPPGVFLADNFDQEEFGQLQRTSPRPSDYTFAYDAGEYVMTKINPALPAAPIVFVPGTFNNSVLAVDVRIMGDVASRYAFVVCRDQSTGGQTKQYRASIVPDGRRVILSRWDSGTQRVLSEARDEPAIRTGNAVNRLELRCTGVRIAAIVNGKVVATADDMTLDKGEHGLGAGTFAGVEGTLEARFDNLDVRSP